jgi:hypothetical protein
MGAEILRDAAVWGREFDLQSSSNRASLEMTAEAQECTPFGATSRVYAVGLPRVPFSFAGYPATDDVELALFTLAGLTDLPLTMSKAKTVGAVAFVGQVLDAEYSTTWSHAEVRTFQSSGELTQRSFGRGRVMHLGSAVAATGAGGIQLLRGISLNKQAHATLHVTAMTGTPTFTGKIESDDAIGFTTPTTRATFTAITNTPTFGSELVHISGLIADTYWRFSWTITGTGTVTFVAALGFEEPV